MGIILSIWSRLDGPLITHQCLWKAEFGAVVGLVVGLVASGIAVVLGKLMEVKHWVRVGSGCSWRAFIVSFKCFP